MKSDYFRPLTISCMALAGTLLSPTLLANDASKPVTLTRIGPTWNSAVKDLNIWADALPTVAGCDNARSRVSESNKSIDQILSIAILAMTTGERVRLVYRTDRCLDGLIEVTSLELDKSLN